MSVIGKQFDIDGSIKNIVNEDETFVYFDGGVAIKKYLLGTKYEEYLDPATFFNTGSKTLLDMANKIKNHDGPMNESTNSQTNVNMTGVYQKPHLGEGDKVVPTVQKFDPNQNQSSVQSAQYVFQTPVNDNVHNTQQNIPQPNHNNTQFNQPQYQQTQPIQADPQEALFKKLKRNTKAVFDLKVEEMIPTSDFIRMMNDNFETSIIDFLSRQTVEKLLNDPDKLRKQIKAQLETTIYGAPIEEEEEEEEIIEPIIVKKIEGSELEHEKPVVTMVEEPIIEEIDHEKQVIKIIEDSIVEETIKSVGVGNFDLDLKSLRNIPDVSIDETEQMVEGIVKNDSSDK